MLSPDEYDALVDLGDQRGPWDDIEHFSDCDGEWPCSCSEDATRPTGDKE